MMLRVFGWTSSAICLLMVAGCENRDPYRRTDVWRPTGASAANLAAQVANPRDLIQGRSASATDTKGSSHAIERIWTDKPRSLGSGSTSGGASGGGGSGGDSGAASSSAQSGS